MSQIIFPPVQHADEHGLLGIGGEPTVDTLLDAYKRGIFPWPWSEEYVAWFAPPKRAILSFDKLHISRSLKKILKNTRFETRQDTAFKEVITRCRTADNRKTQNGTWITEELVNGYLSLYDAGYAHSFEAFRDHTLVGGLYGVGIGRYFSGESMFHVETNASKSALLFCIESLMARGVRWLDCQVMTNLTAQFGAYEVSREEFTQMLKEAIAEPLIG